MPDLRREDGQEGAALRADDRRGLCGTATSIRKVKRSMKHYAGLDVSIKETSICIIDETGKVCREKKVMSHPDDLVVLLNDPQFPLARVGLEAGPLSQWLYEALAKAGLPVICIETRHAKSFLKAQQTNKSDRNDARGIAQMMRVDLFKAVHVKTLTSQIRRALLTARDGLQRNALAIENEIRGILRNFGLKVGMIGSVKYEERIRELLEGMPDLLAEALSGCSIRGEMRATISPNLTARFEARRRAIQSAGS